MVNRPGFRGGQLPDWGGEEVTGKKAWDSESLARNGWPI
jgi:CYTH domain-containing protein